MDFETPFPEDFPEVGDVIKFICRAEGNKNGSWGTVEVLVVGRSFDETTGLHYLTTADDTFKHISYDSSSEWESEGWITPSDGNRSFEGYRAEIHQVEVMRKYYS